MKPNTLPFRFFLLSCLAVASLLLSSCSAGTAIPSGDGTHVWLDQPVTGYLLPLASFTLRAHASHAGGGISQLVFNVNTVPVGSVVTDPGAEFVNAQADWNPSAPGQYTIQALATTPGGESGSEIAYVCVSAQVTQAVFGYSGDCTPPLQVTSPTPALPSTPTSTPTTTLTPTLPVPSPTFTRVFVGPSPVPPDGTPPSISGISVTPPDNVYYVSGCGANTVAVQASVSDPSGLSSVQVVYHYSTGSTYAIGMSGGGGDVYSATINVGSEAYGILAGASSTLTITIQATDKLGNTSSVGAGSVSVQFCPG